MNYIEEINAFYNKQMFKPIPGSAVALWHTLMYFNNRCDWLEEFPMPNTVLRLNAGLKPTAFTEARKALETNGYIVVKKQNGNRAPIYHMVSQLTDSTGGESQAYVPGNNE